MQFNRHSIRIQGYDYSKPGAYFITICSFKKNCVFGKIENGKMILNELGEIVKNEWLKTPVIRPNIIIDEFVIMPNHFHGILIISDKNIGRGTMHRAPTVEKFGQPTSNSIPTIIRGFKSAVTKQIKINRDNRNFPVWQRNYYERIIRDENELNKIRNYINYNPLNWKTDNIYSD